MAKRINRSKRKNIASLYDLVLRCDDGTNEDVFHRLLNHVKRLSDEGGGVHIVVNPDNEKSEFYVDGDGNDKLVSIKRNDVVPDLDHSTASLFKTLRRSTVRDARYNRILAALASR